MSIRGDMESDVRRRERDEGPGESVEVYVQGKPGRCGSNILLPTSWLILLPGRPI